MTLDQFRKIINLQIKIVDDTKKAYELGIEIINFQPFEDMARVNELLWENTLPKEYFDILTWFINDCDFGREKDIHLTYQNRTILQPTIEDIHVIISQPF